VAGDSETVLHDPPLAWRRSEYALIPSGSHADQRVTTLMLDAPSFVPA
jgi:hypothetical protein